MGTDIDVYVASGEALYQRRFDLAARVITEQWTADPSLEQRYGSEGRVKCEEDTRYHILYLSEAVRNNSYSLFRQYLAWAKVLLAGLGIKSAEVAKNLQILLDVVRRELPHEPARVAAEMLERAIAEYPELPDREESKLDPTAPRYELAKAYLQDLLAGRRQVASSRILDAVDEGVPIKDIYLNVFQPTQREVGRLWQVNELTVAQEHYCTAATQMIMCQLYPMLFDQPKNGMTFVGTCVGGELHEIGVRMITDFFELEGWDTYFMGANTPTADLVSTLIAQEAEVLGISATIAYHVRQVEEIVEQVRSKPELSSVRVLVGGYPFNQDRKLWKEVGADGYGADAEDAVQTARRLAL